MRARCLTALALFSAAAWAQRSETLPSFDVASIRLSTDKTGIMTFGPLGTGTYTIGGVMLYGLVQQAYNVPYEQISGIEKLGSERYDVSAKAEPGVLLTPENLAPRMERLLAERFQLAVHKENKIFDGYALVVAKGGHLHARVVAVCLDPNHARFNPPRVMPDRVTDARDVHCTRVLVDQDHFPPTSSPLRSLYLCRNLWEVRSQIAHSPK